METLDQDYRRETINLGQSRTGLEFRAHLHIWDFARYVVIGAIIEIERNIVSPNGVLLVTYIHKWSVYDTAINGRNTVTYDTFLRYPPP